MRLCGTTLPISVGCKIITYLESQTHSFLLTVQLSSGYDDDLLSITAIVKHFQTGKNRFRPPAWQAPPPVRILQPYVVL